MKHFLTATLLAVVLSFAAAARAEIIDRILAVVDGALIMQSDVALAARLALVPPRPAADSIASTLDALIERRLVLAEVDRYAPPEPADADIDRRVGEIRARAGNGFDTALRETGISVDQLRRQARDDLRIDTYLQQRFGAMQPSDEEIQQYYRDHQSSFIQNGVARPLEQIRDLVRTDMMASQRSATIKDWIAGLRRRASVNILPR